MTDKVLCSFGWGEAKNWLQYTEPKMEEYAERHGYDFHIGSPTLRGLGKKYGDNVSWCKIPFFLDLFVEYDTILWLDADVMIVDPSKDILYEAPSDFNMALIKHHSTPYLWHPNCGVWLLHNTQTTYDIIRQIEDMDEHHAPMVTRMWEQGALLTLMGATTPDPTKAWPVVLPETYNFQWTELPMRWNVSSSDLREWPMDAAFLHASTYTQQKTMLLKSWSYFCDRLNNA